MKTIITINGKDVEIELTKDQVNKIKQSSSHYTDIKTLEDALEYIGETVESFNNRTQFDDDVQRAYKELEVIVQAVRQGNELGQSEGDHWYYPWFYSKRSSSGFSYDGSAYALTHSGVGARLCVENSEKAEYLGKQFLHIYDRYINGEKLHPKPIELKDIKKKKFKTHTDIKTFQDACDAVGVNIDQFHQANKHLSPDTYAYEQLKVISKALNGGEHMNYQNTDEYKYYPYFTAVGSSSGFSYYVFICDISLSLVGARLTYKSKEIAKYAGTQFLDIYNKYIN